MIEYVELRLHSGGNVTLLPDYSTCSFDTKYNDLGVLEFTYPAVYAKNLGITDQSMISVVVGVQGGTAPYEVDRYYIENIDDEKVVDGVRMATFSARSWMSGLEDAAVYPSNWPSTVPTGHEFVDQTVGTIFRTLVLRAKNRGGLQQFNETTFTGTQDSLGAAWSHLHTQNYATGTNYYQVLQEFMDRGFVDAWVDASGNLRIVNGGNRGAHIPISTVELRPAKNVSEMTTASQSGESATTVLIEGEEGTAVERHSAAMQTTLGRRRERYVQQGGIADAGVLTLLGDAELSVYGRIPVEESVGLGTTINPFMEFTVGDWVWVRYEVDQPAVERRVRQLAVDVSENREITLGVTLNSILYETDVALARRVEAYAGSGGTYGSVPNTSYDNTTPNPPASVNVTSGTYLTQGKMQAAMSVNWVAPTTNVGGTALTDLAGYQMQWRYDSDPVDVWSPVYPSDDTVVGYSPLRPGEPIDVRVRALDESGHASDWATNTGHVLALDTIPPAKPSKLTVAQKVGAIGIRWDGLSAAATEMSDDFALLEIHGSQTAGFTPTQGDLATLKGTMVGASLLTIPDLPPGQTWYYRSIAVDSTGNASPPSDTSDALVVAKIVTSELSDSINDAIDDAVALAGRVTDAEADIVALQSANGAAQVFYSPTQPSNPAGPATWFKLDNTLANGGNVIEVLAWNSANSSWVSIPFEHQTIASLDMGKATVGLLNAARIDVASLNATGSIVVGQSQVTGLEAALDATLTNSVVEYSVNSSESTAPTTGWSTATPTRTPGTFIWFRTKVTYGDGTTSTTSPALMTGNTGATGSSGPDIYLTTTSQALIVPSGGGATTPATATVTGAALNTTISVWEYSVNAGAFSTTVPAGVSRTGNVVTITGSTMTAQTITVRMADAGGVADTMTVAKVANGADGTNGTNGTNGITVLLSNESHTFAGSTTAAVAGSTTSAIIAYQGTTQQSATIGTITGQVTGLTTSIQNNGTTTAQFTVTVTTSLTAQTGELTVPITVGSTSFTKKFSWSVNRTGASGNNGVSITSVTPYYYQIATGSAAPAKPTAATPPAPWTTTEPAFTWGTELYRTDKVLFSDATYSYTDVVKVSSYSAATALRNLWGLPSDTTYINGGLLANHTVMTHHLLIADYTNYWPDQKGNYPTSYGWNGSGSGTVTQVTGLPATENGTTTGFRVAKTGTATDVYLYPAASNTLGNRQLVTPNEEFHMEAWVRVTGAVPTAGNVMMGCWFYNEAGTYVGLHAETKAGNTFTLNTWTKYETDVQVPDGAKYMWIFPLYLTAAVTASTWDVTDIKCQKRAGGELIIDGAITSKQLKSDEGWVGFMEVDRLIGGELNAEVVMSTGKIEARGTGIVGMSGKEGFYVKGAIPAGGTELNRKRLIHFPINQDEPNIIAGQLTATTGLFESGVTLRGESGIETGASLILHGEIRAPKNSPVVTPVWTTLDFMQVASGRDEAWLNTFTQNNSSEIFNVKINAGDRYGTLITYYRYNATTGGGIGNAFGYNSPFPNMDLKQVVWNKFRGCFHELWENESHNIRLRALNSSGTVLSDTGAIDLSAYSPTKTPVLGQDYDNGNVLVGITSSMAGCQVLGWTTGATGTVTMGAGIGNSYSTTLAFAIQAKYTFLAAGTFDLGSKKIIAKNNTDNTFDVWSYGASGSSSSMSSANNWVAAGDVQGAWWDGTNFYSMVMGSNQIAVKSKYEGGETITTTSPHIWVKYSFYDDVGTVHETPLSNYTYQPLVQVARAMINVSIDSFPTVPGVDSPTKARVYLARTTTSTQPANSSYFLRATTDLTSLVIWPGTNGVAYGSVAAFTASAPAEIQSADNGSYWKGDNTAKFLQLLLASTTDASTGAGNLPPLRTGDPAGKHIRYGTEEIISMDNDSTVGTLYLNRGGITAVARGANGRFQVGPNGRSLQILDSGSGGQTPNGQGLITVNHGLALGTLTYQVLIVSRGNGAFRHFNVTDKVANTFTFRVENDTGALVTSGTVSYDYFIIG